MKLKPTVTGLKTIQKRNKLVDITDKKLSIQVSLNGLSFCIQDKDQNYIEGGSQNFESSLTPFKVLEQLENLLERHHLNRNFQSVQLLFRNEINCLVPNDFYIEEQSADYLKFNSKILKSDFIATDSLESIEAKNVYVPLINIVNYLIDIYGSFEYRHSATILIDSLLKQVSVNEEPKIHLHISGSFFEMVILKQHKLIFYNMFEFSTKEDLIYYVLFTMEQLKLDPEQVEVEIIGKIKEEDELYKIVYRYVRHVSINELLQSLPTSIIENIDNPYLLVNSFSYADYLGIS